MCDIENLIRVVEENSMPLFDYCWNMNCEMASGHHTSGKHLISTSPADYGAIWDKNQASSEKTTWTMNDLFQMSRNDTVHFVKDHFWNAINGDDIAKASTEVATFLFHTSLHHGPAAAMSMLQRVLHSSPKGSRHLDSQTMTQIAHHSKDILSKLIEERRSIYSDLVVKNPQSVIFQKQWSDLLEEGIQQATVATQYNRPLTASPSPASASTAAPSISASSNLGGIDLSIPFANLGRIQGWYKKHGMVTCIFDNHWRQSKHGRIFAGALLQVGQEHYMRFSLDPWEETNPRGPYLRKVYDPPSLAGTVLGDILFEADFLLKKISMGLEPIPPELASKGLESMMEMDIQEDKRIFSRLWFYIREVKVHETSEGIDAFQVSLAVDARRNAQSATGKLMDVPTSEDCNEVIFARKFTSLFKDAQRVWPIFQDLEEACRCIALIHCLQREHLSLEKEAILQWAIDPQNPPHTFKIDALHNEKVTKTTSTRPLDDGRQGEVRTVHTSTRSIFGGVSCQIPALTRVSTIGEIRSAAPAGAAIAPVVSANGAPSTTASTSTMNPQRKASGIRTSSGLTSPGPASTLMKTGGVRPSSATATSKRSVAPSKAPAVVAAPSSASADTHLLTERCPEVDRWLFDLQYQTPPRTPQDLVRPLPNVFPPSSHPRDTASLASSAATTRSSLSSVSNDSMTINTVGSADAHYALCVSHLQTRRCSVCHERIENMDDAICCRFHADSNCAFCFRPLASPPPNAPSTEGTTSSEVVTTQQTNEEGHTVQVRRVPFITCPKFGYSQKAHNACFCCFACNQPINESFVCIPVDAQGHYLPEREAASSTASETAAYNLFFHPHCPIIRDLAFPTVLYPNTWTCLYCPQSNGDGSRATKTSPTSLNLYPHDEHCRRCGRPRDADIVTVAKDLFQQNEYTRALTLYLTAARAGDNVTNANVAPASSSSKRPPIDDLWSEAKRLAALQANICLCYVKLRDFPSALTAINQAIALLEQAQGSLALAAATAAAAAAASKPSKNSHDQADTASAMEARNACMQSLARYWLKRADIYMALSQWQAALQDFGQYMAYAGSVRPLSASSGSGSRPTTPRAAGAAVTTPRGRVTSSSGKGTAVAKSNNSSSSAVDDNTLRIVRTRMEECQARLTRGSQASSLATLPPPAAIEHDQQMAPSGSARTGKTPTAGPTSHSTTKRGVITGASALLVSSPPLPQSVQAQPRR